MSHESIVVTIKLAMTSEYAFEQIAPLCVGYEILRRRAFAGRRDH